MSESQNEKSGDPENFEIVKLDYPFKWTDDEKITEVKIPRPTALHMRGLNTKRLESETDEMFKLVQKLLGQPAKFLDRMDFSDVTKIMQVVERFLGNGPESGKTA